MYRLRHGSFGSFSTELGCPHHVRFTPGRDRWVDLPVRQPRATTLDCQLPRTRCPKRNDTLVAYKGVPQPERGKFGMTSECLKLCFGMVRTTLAVGLLLVAVPSFPTFAGPFED